MIMSTRAEHVKLRARRLSRLGNSPVVSVLWLVPAEVGPRGVVTAHFSSGLVVARDSPAPSLREIAELTDRTQPRYPCQGAWTAITAPGLTGHPRQRR